MKTPDNAPDIKVGHKTPDEIKKGLECCTEMCNSESCPYWEDSDCTTNVRNDVIALIKQLEAERDAAVEDLEALMDSLEIGTACEFCGKDCMFSDSACSPEWRGVQKEATP